VPPTKFTLLDPKEIRNIPITHSDIAVLSQPEEEKKEERKHTHTHTHTQKEREGEREREKKEWVSFGASSQRHPVRWTAFVTVPSRAGHPSEPADALRGGDLLGRHLLCFGFLLGKVGKEKVVGIAADD
jgi:hypothetical protein